MLNFDQAEGLRRMLETPQKSVFSFLSAQPENERSGTVINLSAAFAARGQRTLIVDAKVSAYSVSAWLNLRTDQTLLDVACERRTMEFAVKELSSGLFATKISDPRHDGFDRHDYAYRSLAKVFDIAASRADVVLVDCDLEHQDRHAIAAFEDSKILIQLSPEPASIKAAYAMMKRLHQDMGLRVFNILVSDASQAQGELIFANLANTAQRYLSVRLDLLGCIPEDHQVKLAINSGRSVVEAFPLSKASHAFARITDKLLFNAGDRLRYNSASLASAHYEY